jgi:hypothetical protein
MNYVVGSKSFWPDQIFKVTNKTTTTTSASSILEYVAAWNWYINLAIDGAIYPSQHFPFGPAFVRQAGNNWTLPRMYIYDNISLSSC